MANAIEVNITGLKELQDALERLPKKVAASEVRSVLRKAGQQYLDQVMIEAPLVKRPDAREPVGFLRANFTIAYHSIKNNIAGVVRIGATPGKDFPLASGNYKERAVRKGKVVKILQVGSMSVASVVRFLEYGTVKMAKFPFMSRSWELTKDGMLQTIVDGLKAKLGLR